MIGDVSFLKELVDICCYFGNCVIEMVGVVYFVCLFLDGVYLIMYLDRCVDGIIFEVFIKDLFKLDFIFKIVKGLMVYCMCGCWGNMQENVFILLVFDFYFNIYEKQMFDFFVRVWFGDMFVGQYKFKGCIIEEYKIVILMKYFVEFDGE